MSHDFDDEHTQEDGLSLSRRTLLSGMAGIAVSGLVGTSLPTAAIAADQTAAAPTLSQPLRRIDVHAHYLTDRYRQEATAAGHAKPDGMPGLPAWSVEKALDAMDRFHIDSALLSVSSPGVHFGNDQAARSLARAVNEEGAQAMHDHPKRFGLFASLPLPDIDGALRELEYALDTLKADGIVIESNQHGIYPGDERLDPIFAELDRRGAVLFIHPTSPNCSCCESQSLGYPRPMIEFMFDSSRALTNLILKGTLTKYPHIRLIVPHGGAMMPILIDRIVGLSPALGLPEPLDADQVFAQLRRLYYDLAGFPVPRQLGALLQIADPKRILYGSDWPFTPDPLVVALSKKIEETTLLDDVVRAQVMRGNATALFPRLQ